jgi:DNA-binding CsgD family transcriptional regulator
MGFWFFKKKDDSEIKRIHGIMENSFSNIKKDMGNLSSWVKHFKGKHEEHNDSFDNLVKDIKYVKKVFEDHLEEYHSDDGSSMIEHVQSFKRPVQSFMNVQVLKDKMTPSQKNLLNLLNKANIPLDYETIAKELKLSTVTVRRHMNDIKRLFEIKEMRDVDRGKKVFYIDKKAKMTLKRKK